MLPIVVLIGALTTTTAHAAAPYEHVKYSGSASFNHTICGLDVTNELEFSGVRVIREVKGSDGEAYLAHNNYATVETLTNPDTGRQVIARHNGVFHEQRGTHLGGDIWAFDVLDAGTYTLTTPDGARLLRERGVVKLHQVFDLEGDGQPGGILLSEELTAVNGPHTPESAFCTAFLGALT
jgi:hypothetical protein